MPVPRWRFGLVLLGFPLPGEVLTGQPFQAGETFWLLSEQVHGLVALAERQARTSEPETGARRGGRG